MASLLMSVLLWQLFSNSMMMNPREVVTHMAAREKHIEKYLEK
jgi:hypothetical protein